MKYIKNRSEVNIGDNVLIHYWYDHMICVVKVLEKIGNKYLVSYDNEYSKLQNAPNELISKSDIIDIYRK